MCNNDSYIINEYLTIKKYTNNSKLFKYWKFMLKTNFLAIALTLFLINSSAYTIDDNTQYSLDNDNSASIINEACSINKIIISNNEYYSISGALHGALKELHEALIRNDTNNVINYTTNVGRKLSQMFRMAQNDNDIAQKVRDIARLVEKAIYQYLSIHVFNQQLDIININDINPSNDDEDYIIGYEVGILEEYIKEILPISLNRAITLIKNGMNSLINLIVREIQYNNIDSNVLTDISGNVYNIVLGLKELLKENRCTNDGVNKIKTQLARVCKTYINYTILKNINNIR